MITILLRTFGAERVSKAVGASIGSAIGTGFSMAIASGLPAELATPEIQASVTLVVTSASAWALAYIFPANR